MKRITSRFMMLIATAAVLPLVVYGAVSMARLKQGTETSVREGNLEVAEQVASQVKLYIDNNARILRSAGEELNATSLAPWQQTRILTNHVLEFREFREISILDASGRTIATSRLGEAHAKLPLQHERSTHGVHVAEVFLDDDALPTTDLALKLKSEDDQAAWLVGRLSLEELWRFVDRVRIGDKGYASVFAADRRLIAHGDPAKKRLVALGTDQHSPLPENDVLAANARSSPIFYQVFLDGANGESLATGARV